MIKQQSREHEQVVQAMETVYNILKATGVRDHTGKNLEFLYNNSPSLSGDQKIARQSMDRTIEIISKKNPHISKQLIYDRLLFKIVQQALYFIGDKHDVSSEIEKGVKELFDYKPHRSIDIPIAFLDPGCEPVKFGLVTFYKISDEDLGEVWLKNLNVDYKEFLTCYARTDAVGDFLKSKDDADQVVTDMLTYLRAVGFPISNEPQIQFGVLNNYPPTQLRPYRSGLPLGENKKLEGDIKFSWKLGAGMISYEIPDLLNAINKETLSKLQSLIESDYRVQKTEMRRKFLLGLHWLGESTKPDTLKARIVKLAISIEALIAGESNQENLSSRGITAALAERGAFIAGENMEERKQLHDSITKFYRMRSGIVHGGKIQITEQDLIDFSSLVRKITWSLLNKIDEFSDIDNLQKWIIKQRYS